MGQGHLSFVGRPSLQSYPVLVLAPAPPASQHDEDTHVAPTRQPLEMLATPVGALMIELKLFNPN